tara:strand:- start:7600 stop:8031 length:432 start_codon:yes stop_codon:yes gene_type:complete
MKKNEYSHLIPGKSIIYDKRASSKSRFYLVFDRIEGEKAVGKTFPRKSKKRREEFIDLNDLDSKETLLKEEKGYEEKLIVTRKVGRLNKFLCSKEMNRSYSRSLDQAEFFDHYIEALSLAEEHGGIVIKYQKALNYHKGNKCN